MEKPKIIICATAYRPYVGGVEIAVEEVARRLAGDFDFIIFTARMSRRVPRRESAPEGEIFRLGFGMPLDKWLLPFFAVWRARRLGIDFKKADRALLWALDISQGAMASLAIGWFFPSLPYVLTVQYGESEEYLYAGRWGWIRRSFRAMLMRADSITTISSYLLCIARTHGYCGLGAVVHNGVDREKFKVKNEKVNIQRNRNTIITISRLVPKNGVDVLIRAIAEARKEISDIRCWIAGDGPDRKKLELLASFLGITENVVFLGTVPHDELAGYLHRADVFVRLSRSEGMGNAFVEAIAARVPVIGTRVGGIPDIIEDGKTGLFAGVDDPADCAKKIIRLLRNPGYAGAMATRAEEEIMRRFEWGVIADQYRGVFTGVLGMEKRITIATGLFPPDIGGPATYSALLANALPEEKIGVRVSSFGGVRHLPRLARHALYFVRLFFTARGSDSIFAQDPVSVGLPAFFAARACGTRFILKVVGDYAWEQYQVKSQKIKDKSFETLEVFQSQKHDAITEMRRRIQQFVARRADRIIVPSQYLRRIVAGWGVAEEKIAVVYNSVVMPERVMPRDQARVRYGLSGLVVIAVGRLVPWKGFSALIDAIADIALDRSEICLVIAGSGPEEENLRRKIQERGAAERVRMIGAVPHDVLTDYFSAADIFVLNSGYEGLSHTLIEAMVMGLPVIATRVGGNPEVISDGVEGILIAYQDNEGLRDAVRALAANPDMRATMAAAARSRAGAFTKEKMIRETRAVLKSL